MNYLRAHLVSAVTVIVDCSCLLCSSRVIILLGVGGIRSDQLLDVRDYFPTASVQTAGSRCQAKLDGALIQQLENTQKNKYSQEKRYIKKLPLE